MNTILGPDAKNLDDPIHDAVHRPAHYQLANNLEVIDVREHLLRKIAFSNKCHLTHAQIDAWSRAWEYLTRFMDKNGIEDLHKAHQYLYRCLYGRWPTKE